MFPIARASANGGLQIFLLAFAMIFGIISHPALASGSGANSTEDESWFMEHWWVFLIIGFGLITIIILILVVVCGTRRTKLLRVQIENELRSQYSPSRSNSRNSSRQLSRNSSMRSSNPSYASSRNSNKSRSMSRQSSSNSMRSRY